MKHTFTKLALFVLLAAIIVSCYQPKQVSSIDTNTAALALKEAQEEEEHEREHGERGEYEGEEENEEAECEGIGLALQQEFDKTMDPALGRVPRELLWPAIEYTDQLKQDMRRTNLAYGKTALNGWVERGPYSDVVGVSSANTRANNGVASGRIRAVMVDAADASGNTVFVGGVAGGLWKTTSITSNPANWTVVNDKLNNLAITGICQDPTNPATMYVCTGEANYNADAVEGDGIFKSTNGGASWTQLSSTTKANAGSVFNYCSKIACDSSGNVYVGTQSGLKRSTNGGSSWTDITPSGVTAVIADIEISSTGRLHITTGIHPSLTTAYYRYTDIPATVTASSGWNTASTSFATTNMCRVELACQGNALIALPVNSASAANGQNVSTIYKSTDGGANWSALANTPGFTSGQGWYCLAAAINPSNTSQFLVGSLDIYKTTNGGASSWSQVSNWYGTTGNYVHADQQDMIWYNVGNQSRVLVVCDGGIHISTNGGTSWTDRNVGLRIKQFYSCAIHPTKTNYILGGAQDNGCHALNGSGLTTSIEVTGGDGGYVHIDEDQPQYQFTSYIYNQFRVSTDSGATWNNANLSGNTGLFINPTAYDHAANIMYSADARGKYRRWNNPQTGTSNAVITVTALGNDRVMAVAMSPYTSNRILLAGGSGTVIRVDNAHNIATTTAGTLLGSGMGTISSIEYGGSEDTILVTVSAYSNTQVWYTTNGSSSTPTWLAKDGNLPTMPVRWAVAVPGTNGKKVMVATETGIWVTADITASTPVWVPDGAFPNVRTDMLAYRSSDMTVVAATHGRGMWSANLNDAVTIALPINDFVLNGNNSSNEVNLSWTFRTARSLINFEIERSENGVDFTTIGSVSGGAAKTSYQFEDERSNEWAYYRIKSVDQYGLTQYSNIISIAPGKANSFAISNVYPNPAVDQVNLAIQGASDEKVQLQLFSVSGQLVRNGVQQLGKGNQVATLGVVGVNPGNYLLIATVGTQRYSFVVVKQ